MGFAEVDSGLQFVCHCLESFQILHWVHIVVLLQLNWMWMDKEESLSGFDLKKNDACSLQQHQEKSE